MVTRPSAKLSGFDFVGSPFFFDGVFDVPENAGVELTSNAMLPAMMCVFTMDDSF
jgi:hypothetical protein